MAKNTVVIPAIFETHKNQLRPRRGGGFYLDQKARKQREALILYLKSLPAIPEEMAINCSIVVDQEDNSTSVTMDSSGLYTLKRHPDADGIASAILDAAQDCGVIFNDNRITNLRVEIK